MRVTLATAVLLVCVLGVMATSAPRAWAVSAGFSVLPLQETVDAGAGSSKTVKITVTNTYPTAMTFSLSTEDFAGSQSDPYAAPVFLGGQLDSPITAANWIVPANKSFQLDPGKRQVETVTVNVPTGATGGHYAALLVSSAPQKLTSSLTAQSQVAVLFMINAGGVPPPELKITDSHVNSKGQVVIDYKNTGHVAVQPKAHVVYVDPITGKPVTSASANCHMTTLPNSVGRCVISGTSKVSTGSHTAKTGGHVGLKPHAYLTADGRTAEAALPTEWSSSWSSLLLPLAGLALLGAYFFGFRRRRRDIDDEEAIYGGER